MTQTIRQLMVGLKSCTELSEKMERNRIEKWLLKQEDYTVHEEEKTKFLRRRVVAPFVDYQWDVDTADMRRYEDQKHKYFLLAVDIMSKYVWTVP